MQNPNKAWTIVNEAGNILVNNSILSSLLGYSDEQLRKLKLWDLIVKRSGDKRQDVLEQLDIDPGSGESSRYNGRVVSVTCADQRQVTVSLNIRQLPDSSRYMVYIEPVTRTLGFIDIDREGVVTDVDTECETIFQCRAAHIVGEKVDRLIASIEWPGQQAGDCSRFASTGKTDVDVHFPLSCVVTRQQSGGCRAGVWVYSTLSDLIFIEEHFRVNKS